MDLPTSAPPAGAATLRDAIHRTNGVPEVDARWVAAHRADVRLVDVREPHELTGPLGAIPGVENVPLARVLGEGLPGPATKPVVFVCRSGRRSALAAAAVAQQTLVDVASIEGGMLAWNAEVGHRPTIVEDEKRANAANLEQAIDRTNGVPEVSAQWVHANIGRFRLVDVRRSDERQGPMGLIVQAEHVVLDDLARAAEAWSKDQPLVIHCASGGRSGRAATALERAGFTRVASMEGGMIAWRAAGYE